MRPPLLRAWLEGDEEAIDLFAGGGGVTAAMETSLARDVFVAVNHDPIAIAVHRANHPRTRHYLCDVREVDPLDAAQGRRIGLLWASPDCTHHSQAKGGKPRRQDIRALADVVPVWAAKVRPRVIALENVPEFLSWGPLDAEGFPIPERRGEDFRRWCAELEALGYHVEHRVLTASDFGARTRRKRLFVIARCDGRPIRWPATTHGPGKEPLRTAAECIDWSLECPSIFGRKRPLAEKTLWRIAQGIRRFVLETPRPFVIKVNHGKLEFRGQSLEEPLSTITAEQRGHALVAPTLVQTGYGERPGQTPRALDLHKPLGTLVNGQKHALVSAFLAKHYGDPLRTDGGGVVLGTELANPIGTITARDHHSLAQVRLAQGGAHTAEVRAFLTAYYGSDGTSGQELIEPMRTLTTKHRLGLVTVHGVDFQIVDIGLRMLQPHELLRAQFGRYADGYDLSAAKTKKDQIRLIGNSVPPELVEHVLAANLRSTEAA